MKFKVDILPVVEREIKSLEKPQQDLLASEYDLIENSGIEYVKVRHIQKKI